MRLFVGIAFSLITITFARIPVSGWNISVRGGYDSNVLRLSSIEKLETPSDPLILGKMSTFDSAFLRFSGSVNFLKRFHKRDRTLKQTIDLSSTFYTHSEDKRYWSGHWLLDYSWGPYRHLKLFMSRLNRFYLRDYTDRDRSRRIPAGCYFTDLDHRVSLSYPIHRRTWIEGELGYLQRYYPNPFAEFSLDISYLGFRFSKDFSHKLILSATVTVSKADNITFMQTARASDLDRSYTATLLELPIRYRISNKFIREIGVKQETELRYYLAENYQDPLHSGRSHRDSQTSAWIKFKLSSNVELKYNIEYRSRMTNSQFVRVENLKSFSQIQTWLEISRDFESGWD